MGARDREGDGDVGRELERAGAAGDAHEHVLIAQPQARVPGENRDDLREPGAVDADRDAPGRHHLGRPDEGLDLHQQRPAAFQDREHAGADPLPRLRQPDRCRVLDRHEAVGAHLQDADLVGGAEAVLGGTQHPVRAAVLAVERDDAVDEVLQQARPGQRPVLGDLADEEDGHTARLGSAQELRGGLAHLADAPGRAVEVVGGQGLDRVDGANGVVARFDERNDRLQTGLGDHLDRAAVARQARRPGPYLHR